MALTPQQQQFLDNYVRKHSLKGKGKRKRADSFAEVRDQVAQALSELPQTSPEMANLLAARDAADAFGEALKFDRATDAMKQVLADVKLAVENHDPGADLKELKSRVDDLVDRKGNLDPNLPKLLNFNGPDQPGLLVLARPVDEAADLPRRSVDEAAWLRAAQKLVLERSADLSKLARSLQIAKSSSDLVKSAALVVTPQAVSAVNAFGADILKACRSRVQRDVVSQEMARLRLFLDDPGYASLRVGAGFDATRVCGDFDTGYANLQPRMDPVKRQLEKLRVSVVAGIEKQRPDTADGGKHDGDVALAREALQDSLLGLPQLPRGKPTRGEAKTFDKSAVLQGIAQDPSSALVNSTTGAQATDKAFQDVSKAARELLKQELVRQNLKPGSDEIFDLTMQSATDFGNAYAIAQGWDPTKPKTLTAGQKAMMAAVGAGMVEHARTLCENQLDANSKAVTLGGQKYGKPKLLSKGGMGAVYRYESETNPGQFIVLKSLLSEEPKDRKAMVKELRGHRHLMQGQGDPSATGAKNIVSMEGAVIGSDGSLHMAMEMVSGGDIDDNRHALDIAGDTGAIPEQVRSLINQSRFKQAVEGLVYMRDQNLVHFDIKGANFMVAEDGTVKVADFGSASVGSEDTGTLKPDRTNLSTAGYAPDLKMGEQVDASFDAFALGKMMEAMHQQASTPQELKKGQDGHKALTGALGRVMDGMTNANAKERISLESVLSSSYVQELESWDPEALKKVSVASIAYGKALKAETDDVLKTLPPELIDLAAQRSRCKREEVGFTSIAGVIRMIIEESQAEIGKLRPQVAGAKDEVARHDINARLDELQGTITQHQKYLARFGQSAPAKKLAAELRELSEQLLRPQDAPGDEDKKALLDSLHTSNDSPGEFCALLALRSHDPIWKSWGADPQQLRALIRLQFEADISIRNDKALELLKNGLVGVEEATLPITEPAAKAAVKMGLANMMRGLMKQYQNSRKEGA
ncbi:MAG TPA: protein kinase [Burkholderiaceae bacterium]|jgi:serine/threonine protein kinase